MIPVKLLLFSISLAATLQRVLTTPAAGPHFLAAPSDTLAVGGTAAELSCTVSGSPPPLVSWFKDGASLALLDSSVTQAPSGSLVISSVQQSDVGDYHCTATNDFGSLQSLIAHLEIASLGSVSPPTSSGVCSRTVVPNEPLVLSCDLPASTPAAEVQWSPARPESGRVGVTLQGSLVFSYYDTSIDGPFATFSCSVSNPVTGQTLPSSSHFICSSGQGQVFHQVAFVPNATLQPQSVIEGDLVQFQCFTTGRAEAQITWEKDGVSLMSSGRVILSQGNRVLSIPEALRGDAGEYSCTASQSSSVGEQVITSQALLTVTVPPAVVTVFPSTSVNVSETVSLSCSTEGDPPLSWQWRHNTDLLVPSQRLQFNSDGSQSTLTISSALQSDAGVYQCIVTQPATGYVNAANNLLSTALLPPTVVGGPGADQLVLTGGTVVFPCTATGFPLPSFTWYRAGQPIDAATMSRYSVQGSTPGDGSLTISPTQVSDSSTLQCNASNVVGFDMAHAVQLVVIAHPTVRQAPMDVTPTAGQLVTLPCEISVPAGVDTVYSWRRDGVEVHIGAGVLNLPMVSESLSGRYECVALLSVDSIEGPPLEFSVGFAVVTVGGPATPPSPPHSPSGTNVSSSSFQANWLRPLDNGRLPLQNYTVEILNRGNEFCEGSADWQSALLGIDPDAGSAQVNSLLPYTGYEFRVVAFNSVYRSAPSVTSGLLETAEAAPSEAPTQVQARSQQDHSQLLVTWQPLSDCTAAGGVITGYTVRYREEEEEEGGEAFTTASTDQLELLLQGLAPSVSYQLQVAAHTATGIGPYSSLVTATTSNEPPANLMVSAINSSAVLLSWEASSSTASGFTVTYTSPQGSSGVLSLNSSARSVVITSLSPDQEYQFTVAITGESPSASVSITLPPAANGAIYEQTWFIAVVPSVGTVVILVTAFLLGLACFMCCYRCSSDRGKIYISSRRSGSSMSASSGFSEYQHKHKVMSRFVKVHASPTPSRRSTDYADLESVRPNIGSAGPPSINDYTGSIANSHVANGRTAAAPPPLTGVDNPDGYNHSLEKPQVHVRQMSGSTQQFFDTMNRVHTPPLPSPDDLNTTASSAMMSDSTDESWNPTENLNYRGHMSNMVSRTNSERSTQSSECGGRFVRVQQPQKFVATNVHNLHNDLRYPEQQQQQQHFNPTQQAVSLQEMERRPPPPSHLHHPHHHHQHHLSYPHSSSLEMARHRDPHRDQLPPEPHTLPGYNHPRMQPVSSPQLQTLPEAFPEDKYLPPPPPPFQASDAPPPPPPSSIWYADHTTHPPSDDIDMPDNFSHTHSTTGNRGNRPIAVHQYNKLLPKVALPTYSFPNKQFEAKNNSNGSSSWNSAAESVHLNSNGRTKPKVAPKPTHINRTTPAENSIAINRVPPSIPDLTSLDPRKPQLRQGKVPRSVWEQRPTNRAIESSSESDYASDSDSLDTVVPGDNTSLKSSHV